MKSILTDVILTGDIGGRDIAEALMQRKPKLKVLYMSGYTESTIVHQLRFEREPELLRKPFAVAALSKKLREVLTG